MSKEPIYEPEWVKVPIHSDDEEIKTLAAIVWLLDRFNGPQKLESTRRMIRYLVDRYDI